MLNSSRLVLAGAQVSKDDLILQEKCQTGRGGKFYWHRGCAVIYKISSKDYAGSALCRWASFFNSNNYDLVFVKEDLYNIITFQSPWV
jgi:hypothetical protein